MTIAPSVFAPYADDIAFVAEEAPAATAEAFISQLGTASSRFEDAGITGADDLEAAAIFLSEATVVTGDEETVLLSKARDRMSELTDMVDEYRLMV